MSDLLEDAAPRPTVTIAGQQFPIAELNLYDRADLQRADRALYRDRLVEDCQTIGATQAETYQELDALRDKRWGDAEWAALANSTDGKVAILERALEKANAGRGRELVAAIRWNRGQVLDVVALVAGLEVNAGGGEEEEPTDPPAGRPGPTATR